MIRRLCEPELLRRLRSFPVVALLGPRQVGKTTLAMSIANRVDKPCTWLDLERPSDRAKLTDAEGYLGSQTGRLTVLDEVQRTPELFPLLRSLVDERIRAGERTGHFLVLGSASPDLLRQSSESLAGRISYLELAPLQLLEATRSRSRADPDRLWQRGGFPGSYLARNDASSTTWREQFIRTYVERDLPQLGFRLSAVLHRRLWTMLAHSQGALWNGTRIANGLGVSAPTARHHLDVLTELFLVRQLPAWSTNGGKRLVKSPKVYVRDSGLAHTLVGVDDLDTLLGHPICGGSWEGFVIENLHAYLPATWRASHYRTGAGAEIDLVLEGPRRQVLAVEINRSLAPVQSRGFHSGFADVQATRGFFVMPAGETFRLSANVEAVSLATFVRLFRELTGA